MEDYILREIDRIGEMLQHIARRLGLLNDNPQDYSMKEVKEEFDKESIPFDLDAILQQENTVWYLVEKEKLSDQGLETMIEIIFHSDLDEDQKQALLNDALAYLDGKGYFSFKLHSLVSLWHETTRLNSTGKVSFCWRDLALSFGVRDSWNCNYAGKVWHLK